MREEAHIPDLVFVDLCLPIIDGYGIIQRLKARAAFAPTLFVMISRRYGMLDRLKGRLAGASAYLGKPCKTQEIVAVVQTYLGTPGVGNTTFSSAVPSGTVPGKRELFSSVES